MIDPAVMFPIPVSSASAGGAGPAGVPVPSCPRCGDPMTGGCTGQRCIVFEADVAEADVAALARWLYDFRYGAGRYEARFVNGPEAGEARHTVLLDEAHALLGSFVLGDLGWRQPPE